MKYLRNGAIWILASGIAIYWLLDFAIGTDTTRDIMDMLALFVSVFLALRLIPHAWRAFKNGGDKEEWRLLFSNCLFWTGIAAMSIWAFSYRWYDRPDWMTYSPLNGFFRYWIVAAGVLAISASTDTRIKIPQDRIYYTLIVGVACFAVGIIVARTFWP